MSRLLPFLIGFLFAVPLQAAPETPFACEVIRPTSQADTLQITMSALTEGARRRAVVGNPSPIQIDVMEVYGPVMLHNAGSAETAAAVLQHAVDTSNQALKDSGLGYITLRLRHVRFSQNYDTFPGPAPGQEIKDDRQYYGADLIGFAVGTTPLGIGAAGCRPPTYGPDCGDHWVQSVNFFQYPLAYVHEVGHNLGADHDAPNAPPRNTDSHPFARAHCAPGQWRTLMSYGNPCFATAVLLFSNPGRMFRGLPTGVPDEEDNARVIALSAPLVRDYYPSTSNTGPRCEFRITFDGSDLPVGGATRTVVADRTRGDCEPAIASLDDWIHIDPAPNSTPEHIEAQVTYSPNAAPLSRRGHFVIGEQPVSVGQAGAAECLLPNGSFDHDLSGWTLRPDVASRGTAAWSALDADNNTSSGSLKLTTQGPSFGVQRCVAIDPSSQYILRSSAYMPPGQTISATDLPAFQSVSLFNTTDCSGDDSGGGDEVQNVAPSWLQIESRINTSATAHSAKLSLNVNVSAGDFTTYFDNIHLCKVGNATNGATSNPLGQ